MKKDASLNNNDLVYGLVYTLDSDTPTSQGPSPDTHAGLLTPTPDAYTRLLKYNGIYPKRVKCFPKIKNGIIYMHDENNKAVHVRSPSHPPFLYISNRVSVCKNKIVSLTPIITNNIKWAIKCRKMGFNTLYYYLKYRRKLLGPLFNEEKERAIYEHVR